MSIAGPLRVMMVAGEPSGDALGGSLLCELHGLVHGSIEAFGVGGPWMAQYGLESIFPMHELSVMGIAEVLPRIPNLRRRIAETIALAVLMQPDVLITIDSPDFCFRVARQVRRQAPGIKIIHYVAPQVWAWRRGRARKIARYIDHLLALLPFEPPIFIDAGLPCTFVGHPVIERAAVSQAAEKFREHHFIPPQAPLLAVLPGSRLSETSRLLPVFGEALKLLVRAVPDLHAFTATVPGVANSVIAAAADWPVRPIVTKDAGEKAAGFAACDAALAASGTVSLELAINAIPHVIAYKVNPLTAMIARQFLKISNVNLINLVLGETLIPELLQEACTPANVAGAVLSLLRAPRPSPTAELQRIGMKRALNTLGMGGEKPSLRAARAVLTVLKAG